MNFYEKEIRNCIKNGYKESKIYNKFFLSSYLSSRKNLKEKLNQFSKKKNSERFIKDKGKRGNTFAILKKLKSKKILNFHDKKIIYIFYKKFEINLKLKKNYNKFYTKTNNKETCLYSYILLGSLIKKLNTINKLQKLNFFLKVLDLIKTKLTTKIDKYYIKQIKSIISEENNIIQIYKTKI